MEHTELVELAKWGLGLFGGVIAFVSAAIALLFRIAFKLGSDATAIKEALVDIGEIKKAVEKLPIIEQRVGTLEDAWKHTRSDIKDLLGVRRGSRPEFDGE